MPALSAVVLDAVFIRRKGLNPDNTRVIARIVSAVAPYPDARAAVIAALRDLDMASASTPALTEAAILEVPAPSCAFAVWGNQRKRSDATSPSDASPSRNPARFSQCQSPRKRIGQYTKTGN